MRPDRREPKLPICVSARGRLSRRLFSIASMLAKIAASGRNVMQLDLLVAEQALRQLLLQLLHIANAVPQEPRSFARHRFIPALQLALVHGAASALPPASQQPVSAASAPEHIPRGAAHGPGYSMTIARSRNARLSAGAPRITEM